jgi:NADH:ubiquinone oxidoreductase subunit C
MLLEQTLAQIKEKFPDPVLETTEFAGEQILHVKGQDILTVLTALKANGFNFLADLTAIDNLTLGGYERFAVSYHLLCHKTAERLTVKAYVPEENRLYLLLNPYGKRQTGKSEKYLIYLA